MKLDKDLESPNPSHIDSRGRLASMDCLRGFAALAVLGFHIVTTEGFETRSQNHPGWLKAVEQVLGYGWTGVPLFFLISGFCIHLSWCKRAERGDWSSPKFGEFWRRRLHRLYPPYLVALTATMALVVVKFVGWNRGVEIYPDPKALWIGFDYLIHLFMLQGFSPRLDLAGGNPVYWTLAREEYFYLLYFPLLAFRRRRGLVASLTIVFLLGLAISAAAWHALPPGVDPGDPLGSYRLLYTSAPVRWIQWCLGMACVEAYCRLVKFPAWCSSFYLFLPSAVLAILSQEYVPVIAPSCFGLACFILINFCVRLEEEGRWPKKGVVAWLGWVGAWSYSLYLVHLPVTHLVGKTLAGRLDVSRVGPYALCTAIQCIAALAAGRLFFIVVESRFLNRKSRPGTIKSTRDAELPVS